MTTIEQNNIPENIEKISSNNTISDNFGKLKQNIEKVAEVDTWDMSEVFTRIEQSNFLDIGIQIILDRELEIA